MTIQEMNDEFDLLYDAASQEAPGLDAYEKSVFLTKGMMELAQLRYEEYLNRASRGFHDDELNRDALKGFIASAVIEFQENPVTSSKFGRISSESNAGFTYSEEDMKKLNVEKTVPWSAFFKRPKDSMGILYEDVSLEPVQTGNVIYDKKLENKVKGKRSSVVPVRYDHVMRLMKNPYTKPTPDVAFRLDHSDYDGGSLSEIITDSRYSPKTYRVKYIKIPYPIILVDLDEEFPNQGLSIEGQTKPYKEPQLTKGTGVEEKAKVPIYQEDTDSYIYVDPDEVYAKVSQATNVDATLHHDIVQRGVELAILHYRENTLANNMQTKINLKK